MRGALWLLGLFAVPTVAGPGRPHAAPPVTFADHVLPLLQRQGCASAYCHGSATGRGGFKLSLFGSDPDADWRALAIDLGGRRLDLRDPDRSLLLQKGSGRVPHGGGTRLPRDAAAYALLRDWIAVGAPRGASEPAANGLAVELVGEHLQVTATMPNGPADVTALAVFSSSEETVVAVAADGRVTAHGLGEAFVTARYGGRDAVLRIVRPAGDATNAPAAGHTADRAWLSWLGELGLPPAPRASPHRLARRLHLDLAGRPPAPHEVQAFVDLPAATAVAVTVDRLLASSAFTDEFARHLAEMFEVAGDLGAMRAERQAARDRLHAAVAAGQPLDELVRELLAPESPLLERISDPRDRAEFVGRAFLGMQIGCARCHDHPNDRWQQRDHQGFAALLATRRGSGGELLAGAVFDETTGAACPPVMLPIAAGAPAAVADLEQRHHALRDALLTDSDAFAENFCNRLLGWLLGRAPVEPVDDHRLANPARCAPLLAAAVAEYRRSNGDLRSLVRWVVTSAPWAVDSEPVRDHDELAARYFARQQARPLSADRLARASAYVLDVPATALPVDPLARELNRRHGEWLGAAVRSPGGAIDLIAATANGDAALAELFLQILGRPPRADEIAELLPRLSTPPLRDRLIELAQALLLTREFASRR